MARPTAIHPANLVDRPSVTFVGWRRREYGRTGFWGFRFVNNLCRKFAGRRQAAIIRPPEAGTREVSHEPEFGFEQEGSPPSLRPSPGGKGNRSQPCGDSAREKGKGDLGKRKPHKISQNLFVRFFQ